MINYTAVRLVHRVDPILNNEETARRLREVGNNPYPRNARCNAIAKTLTKMSGMSKTEMETLATFPEGGINIGMVSCALLFADVFRYMSVARHKAIVSLLKQGSLAIVEGYRIDTATRDRMEQIIVKV